MPTFGRSKNVVRRPVRPDRNFLRNKRRGGIDGRTFLEANSSARRPGLISNLFSFVRRLFTK